MCALSINWSYYRINHFLPIIPFDITGFDAPLTGDDAEFNEFTDGFTVPETIGTEGFTLDFRELTPVLPTYLEPIVEGFIPPALLMIFAHFGICLSATSGAYFLPQYLHSV